ncbi:ABC transporter permease [Caproiciproducens sp.]
MKRHSFTGTKNLAKLYFRRDRWLLLLWTVLPVLMAISVAKSAMAYQDIQLFIKELTINSLISSILGPGMSSNIAGVVVWRSTGQIAIILGIAMMLTVIRHTRSEEEAGRSEMLRAYVTGRYASLTAALSITGVSSLMAGLLVAIYFISLGQAAGSSLLYGATIALIGYVHAGIGALVAQLSKGTDKARGLALAFAGAEIFFLLVNNGQGAYSGWALLSPMAWHRLTQPFYTDRVWTLILMVILVAIPVVSAYVLSARRDLGEGVLPERSGRDQAAAGFSSPLALAWRLQKSSAIGVLVGMVLIGGAVGGMAQSVSETEGIGDLLGGLGGVNWMAEVGNRNAFISIFIYILTMAVAVYAMMSTLRLQKEEFDYHAEMILAKPVSRIKWMFSYLLVSILCVTGIMLALGFSAGIVFGATSSNFGQSFQTIFVMCLTKIPVVWTMVGISALLYGILPRMATIFSLFIWGVFTAIEFLWEGQIVSWSAMQFVPYAYAHYTIPVDRLPILPLIVLVLLAFVLQALGLLGFKKRSIGQV